MVSSVNGKITKGDDPVVRKWTSKEDNELFDSLKKKYALIVMGRKTYEVGKKYISRKDKAMRVVLTRNPKKYSKLAVRDKLEFTSLSPKRLIRSLESRGYSEMLLVGGGIINSLFLKAGLIDELRITIEPVLFGEGKELLDKFTSHVRLKLLSVDMLNNSGTQHNIYKILKNKHEHKGN